MELITSLDDERLALYEKDGVEYAMARDELMASLRGALSEKDDGLTVAYMAGFHKRDDEVRELEATLARYRKAAITADRWRVRKGHGPDHDCDLCNAPRDAALREVEGK